MATVGRRDPDADDVGLNWSCWIDKCHILTDEGGGKEEDSVDESRGSNTMTLSREDMKIYGYCPALDNFYLVVCSHCGKLVKPQAFEAHCERRHGALTKLQNPSSGLADQQRPQPGRLPSIPSPREGHKTGETQEAAGSSKTASAPQHRTTKLLTEDASSPSVKTSGPQEAPPSSTCPSHSHPRAPPQDHAPLAPPVSSSSSPHSSASPSEKQKPDTGPSGAPQSPPSGAPLSPPSGAPRSPPSGAPHSPPSGAPQSPPSGAPHSPPSGAPQSPLRGNPRPNSRTHSKVHKTECDLDTHCGVLDPARETLCTPQLMCNIHSVHQRRKVVSEPFHQLELQQRTGSSGHVENLSASEDSPTPMPCLQMPQDAIKCTLGTNSPMLWGSEEEGAVEVEVQPPYPFNQSLPSSGDSEEEEGGAKEDEEDDEEEEEEEGNGNIPASPWHPKPLGICTFGSHTLGCSIFTFDRRLHHLRFALSDMVEQHVNAHLWKRIPPVPAGLQSCHPATTTQEAAIKPRASFSEPSSGSPSSGPSRPRRNKQNLPSSKPPSTVGPYPTRIPLRQPGKAPLKVREPIPMVAVVPNPARLNQSCSSRAEVSMRIRKFPLHEKDQWRHPLAAPLLPPIMSPHGPANRHHFSTGAKASDRGSPSPSNGWSRDAFVLPPHHPPQPSNLRRGRGVGTELGCAQQKPGGLDFRGPAQKRKMGGSEVSASGHATLTRSSSKPCHSPTQSPSGLFSWRKAASVGTSSGV